MVTRQTNTSTHLRQIRSSTWLSTGLIIVFLILLICFLFSVLLGAADINMNTIVAALLKFDNSTEHLIIRTIRLPRAILAVLVGAALATAGAISQGLWQNSLATPDILGIDMGAALAIVLAIFIAGNGDNYVGFAFVGATVAAIIVYWLGTRGRNGLTSLNLIIAGSALWYLLSSLTYCVLILNQRTLDEIRFWLAGSLAGQDFTSLASVLPYLILGLVCALTLGRPLTLLLLGEDVAKGLGLPTQYIKIIAASVVVLLAGSAVALAGPIGFVGLVVPHIVRFFIGIDYRWLLPYSMMAGAILLLLADIAARLLIRPEEIPVGVMTALIGAPFFIYLARSRT